MHACMHAYIRYVTLRYIALHCIALHYITLPYITLHTYLHANVYPFGRSEAGSSQEVHMSWNDVEIPEDEESFDEEGTLKIGSLVW